MTLPYPDAAVGWEVTFLILLLVLEQSRLFLGKSKRLIKTQLWKSWVLPDDPMARPQ